MSVFTSANPSPALGAHLGGQDTANRAKRVYGADRVREIGMRTDRAEAARLFGPDWLDK